MRSLVTPFFVLIAFASISQTNTFPASGNVGIGTTSPIIKTQIETVSGNTNYSTLNNSDVGLFIKNNNSIDNNFGIVSFGDASNYGVAHVGAIVNHSNHTGRLFFSTRSGSSISQKMVVDENGKVGIGNLFPTQILDVKGRTIVRSDGVKSAGTWFTDPDGTLSAFVGLDGLTNSNSLGLFHGSWRLIVNSIGDIGVGTQTPSSRFDVRGKGTATSSAFRIADNTNVERMRVLDNGETIWQAGTNNEVKIGTNGGIYPGGSSIRTMYIINSGANLLEINGNSTPTLRFGQSSYHTAIRGGGSTINSPVFSIGTEFNAGLGFSNPSSGEVGVTLFYDDNVSTKAGFTLSSQGRWGMTLAPQHDDQLTQLLVRDDATGEIKYRSASSLQGVASPWVVSGSDAHYDSGNIGIGISNPQNKLDVNGTVHSKEVKVDLNNWPDYVFDTNYEIQTLDDLKTFIKVYKHLPDVPTAKEVSANGVMLGEMNKVLLKKIEEITLHLIELSEENQSLKQRIDKLEAEN